MLIYLQYYEMSYGLNIEMHKQVRHFVFQATKSAVCLVHLNVAVLFMLG